MLLSRQRSLLLVEQSSRTAQKWSRAGECYAAALLLLYVVILLRHAEPPALTDYANWIYQGVLLRDHLLGRPDAAHVLKRYPVPNSATTIGIGLLSLLLPWKIAAKLWLCLQLAISFAALRHLLRTIGASAAAWVIVPGAIFLNINFWYGFMNFQLGLAWVILMASLLLRRVRDPQAGMWSVGLLLLLAFFTHMIPFAFCCLMLLLFARQTRRYITLRVLIATAVLCLWYAAGRYLLAGNADGQAGMTAAMRDYSAAFWEFKLDSYVKSFGFVNPMSAGYLIFGDRAFVALFCLNAVICLLAGWAMIITARHAYRSTSDDRFLWNAILIMLPLFLLAPGTALGVSDPGARLLQTTLALGLVLCGAAGQAPFKAAAYCSVCLHAAGAYLFAISAYSFLPNQGRPGTALPPAIADFAHVPNDNQRYLLGALSGGKTDLKIFPTGMFLNR